MKLRTPEYFKDFHCIADKCRDCCCIGWEIDIDDKTANNYSKIPGKFGEKLRSNINFSETKSFILDKHERCPFLNNKNLCEIFMTLGENSLCEICKEHPRYYEWFNGIKEGGIGLCCEEACRIILSQNKSFKTYETEIPFESSDKYDYDFYLYLYESRNIIISYLDNTELPLNLRIRNVLWYTDELQHNIDNNKFDIVDISSADTHSKSDLQPIIEFFLNLEPFDVNWIAYLKNCINVYNNYSYKMAEFENAHPEVSRYLQNISIYFIWRYFFKGVFDADILSKVKLMAVSVAVIKFLFFCKWVESGDISFDDCVIITKNYSKEIEYSEDNLLSLVEAYYEIEGFSVEKLIGLFW